MRTPSHPRAGSALTLCVCALAFSVAACGSPATPADPSPTASRSPLTTPVAPTLTQPTATSEPRPVTFTTADGVSLHGRLYGSGDTAIIFSEMGAQKQETWASAAQALAEQGYLTLTYDFRYWVSDTSIDGSLRDQAADDLMAALGFVQAQGARRVVLVGASLGALATIKVAAAGDIAAVVIVAAPLGPVSGLNLHVTAADVQAIQAPKLFIASQQDEAGFADDVQQMFDLAADPKAIEFYPGRAHGTDLLTTASGPEVIQRLIAFVEMYAPPKN